MKKYPDRIRLLCVLLVAGGILMTSAAADCESDFRQAAIGPVGDGVKQIANGLLDGVIAAVRNAGDGPATE